MPEPISSTDLKIYSIGLLPAFCVNTKSLDVSPLSAELTSRNSPSLFVKTISLPLFLNCVKIIFCPFIVPLLSSLIDTVVPTDNWLVVRTLKRVIPVR